MGRTLGSVTQRSIVSIMATEMATLLAQSTRHELALETQLEAVNDRLKEAKRRVRVVVPSKRHRTLHLRATLPAMPEEIQGPPKMKTITIRLAAPEAAMLIELQKLNKYYRDVQSFFLCQIREEYMKQLGLE